MKNEINLMLSSLMRNKIALAKFYKIGYFSYSKDKTFKGGATIVNGNAIVSFMQDVNDDSKVIATAIFQDNTTTIIQLNGEEFSRIQFGKLPCKLSSTRESVISDISSVQRYCTEAEERLTSSNFIKSIFSKTAHSPDRKLSKQDVRFMLETTLDKLQKSLKMSNGNKVSPKVETTGFDANTIFNSHSPIYDKTPEI